MEHYSFLNKLSAQYSFGFEPSLFNLTESLHLQATDNWVHYYILNEKRKRVEAQIHFFLKDDVALSPLRNPFGSIEFAEKIPVKILYDFICYFENELKELGIKEVVIKNYPEIYNEDKAALLTTFFMNHGYAVADAEIAAVIDTTQHFNSQLSSWEQRKLNQANEHGCTFSSVDQSEAENIFTFIEACRRAKNYHLSMTLEQLNATIKASPDRFVFFAVKQQLAVVAASIAIKVKSTVLYNFYMDHDAAFDHLSPGVKLIEGIHSYCASNKIKFLDLGTSAINGQPNFGLLNFKLNLGAVPSSKFTFAKVLK